MNTDQLETFLWWLTERQQIYQRRFEKDEDPPWTTDPILRQYHFCNVYRELDATTQYLLENIVSETDNRDVFFNIVWFRLLNKPESYEASGGFTRAEDFCPETVVERLQAFATDHSVFSPAYRVTAHRFTDSDSKIENIVHGIMAGDVCQNVDDYLWDLLHTDYMHECHEVLTGITGVGDFLAYELLTDLNYAFLPYDENHFVNIGPGAAKGLERLFDEPRERHVWWLMENQDHLFETYDLEFDYWDGKRLTLRDFEHGLCEWNKYERLKQGGGNVRRFSPGTQLAMTEFL